jgi:hypothetical protein
LEVIDFFFQQIFSIRLLQGEFLFYILTMFPFWIISSLVGTNGTATGLKNNTGDNQQYNNSCFHI